MYFVLDPCKHWEKFIAFIRMPEEVYGRKTGKSLAVAEGSCWGHSSLCSTGRASASRFGWQWEGETGLLRAIISSISGDLPIQPGWAPTYTRALGRCWAGFWAVVGFEGLLTYSPGPGPVGAAWAAVPPAARCPISHALTH